MELHKVLARQLTRLKINENHAPDLKHWQEFLSRVNNHYIDADNDRYTLERSMNLSSKELLESNKKLEEAQHLAGIGYWYHDVKNNKNTWSKEIFRMLKHDMGTSAPSVNEFDQYIYEDDYVPYMQLVNRALQNGEDYEMDIRIKINNKKGDYKWFRIIGKPILSRDEPIHEFRGVMMNIDNAKKAEMELKHLHDQLMITARRAGMTEVATSILHNVGNILNSVNVSMSLLNENMNSNEFKKFQAIIDIIQKNSARLAEFFTLDEKGKLIPEYTSNLINLINDKFALINKELVDLTIQINHIKDITGMQKQLSGVSGIIENVYVPEVIDSSIKMSCTADIQQKIKIVKKLDNRLFIETDKSKLTQIIVNLIQNAADSLMASGKVNKELILQLREFNNMMELTCEDNGTGIDAKNLIKIFSFGFTTKKHGHGFGLHSSAIAAQELGGKIEVVNKGKNEGVIFKVTLPLKAPERRHHEQEKVHEDNSY